MRAQGSDGSDSVAQRQGEADGQGRGQISFDHDPRRFPQAAELPPGLHRPESTGRRRTREQLHFPGNVTIAARKNSSLRPCIDRGIAMTPPKWLLVLAGFVAAASSPGHAHSSSDGQADPPAIVYDGVSYE